MFLKEKNMEVRPFYQLRMSCESVVLCVVTHKMRMSPVGCKVIVVGMFLCSLCSSGMVDIQ